MRIGQWQETLNDFVPIPESVSAAFGIRDGARLHMAVVGTEGARGHRTELIVSPVPVSSWRKTCRLSVRLQNIPGALLVATDFAKRKRINLMFVNACATYADRAHWEAICDVGSVPGFSSLQKLTAATFEGRMAGFLAPLTQDLRIFIGKRPDMFPPDAGNFAEFKVLTGLNAMSFVCDRERYQVVYRAKGIQIPQPLADTIRSRLGDGHRRIPSYVLLTGNTEQRYLRILFLREYEDCFMAIVRNKAIVAGASTHGTLSQILGALPKIINILKVSNYIEVDGSERDEGWLEILGMWPGLRKVRDRRGSRVHREELRRSLEGIVLRTGGRALRKRVVLHSFVHLRDQPPRVFISYSTGKATALLEELQRALQADGWEPVVGTQPGVETSPARGTTPDVVDAAFARIPSCVAFVGLGVKRDDFKTVGGRYILPPWTVAEEAFAWSRDVGHLVRLVEVGLEDPRFNRHVKTILFVRSGFKSAVRRLCRELEEFRGSPRFEVALRRSLDERGRI